MTLSPNAQWAFDRLVELGWHERVAAAIVGNLMVESRRNVNPAEIEDTYGLNQGPGEGTAQWTYWSRIKGLHSYAEMHDLPWDDLGVQIAYLDWELRHEPFYSDFGRYFATVTDDTPIEEITNAAIVFLSPSGAQYQGHGPEAYAAGAADAHQLAERQRNAEEVLNNATPSEATRDGTRVLETPWGDQRVRAPEGVVPGFLYEQLPFPVGDDGVEDGISAFVLPFPTPRPEPLEAAQTTAADDAQQDAPLPMPNPLWITLPWQERDQSLLGEAPVDLGAPHNSGEKRRYAPKTERAVEEVLGLTDRVSAKGAAEVVRQVAPPTRAWHGVESAIRGAEDDAFALHEIGHSLGRHARSVAQQGGPKQEVAAALAVEKAIVDAIDRPTGGEYSKARALQHGRAPSSEPPAPQPFVPKPPPVRPTGTLKPPADAAPRAAYAKPQPAPPPLKPVASRPPMKASPKVGVR